jgi:hypothetical protein
MKYTFPANYAESDCYLVAINVALLPLVAGALKHFEERRCWHTDEEYESAYNAFAALEACMTSCCVRQLIDSNDRIYRLLDSALNGAVYAVAGAGTLADPYLYEPAMPLVPQTLPGEEPSLKFSGEKTLRLIDNLVNATTYTDAPDNRNIRDMLQEIIDKAEGTGEFDEEIRDKLIQIALALA